jgi:hypothetical protein
MVLRGGRPLLATFVPAKKGARGFSHAPKDPYAPINPKDILAVNKLPLHLIPETSYIEESLAYLEGALKYGKYNWRAKPVKASVYIDALLRHLLKYLAGSNCDPATFVKHLGYIRCCAGILIDAAQYGTLVDDRPPRGKLDPKMDNYIDSCQDSVAHLYKMFGHIKPKQWTIQDKVF